MDKFKNGFDGIAEHEEMKNIVDEKGWAGALQYLNEQFPNRDLGSISQAWYDDSKYILKARGGRGDIIIGWYK